MAHRPLSREELAGKIQEIDGWPNGFDLVSDQIIVSDADANILYLNKAALEATGYTKEEMLGKTPGDLWGGLMSEEFYKEMWDTIKNLKKPWIGHVKNKRKDGTEYWAELRISPVLDENGNLKFFIAIEPNITAMKERELKDKVDYIILRR